jgi:hypothetical protein
VFEYRVLRRIFGAKTDEMTEFKKKKCIMKTFVTCTLRQVKEDEMSRACSINGVWTNAYRILVGKPEGRRRVGRHRHEWMDNTKMNLRWTRLICLTIGISGGLL